MLGDALLAVLGAPNGVGLLLPLLLFIALVVAAEDEEVCALKVKEGVAAIFVVSVLASAVDAAPLKVKGGTPAATAGVPAVAAAKPNGVGALLGFDANGLLVVLSLKGMGGGLTDETVTATAGSKAELVEVLSGDRRLREHDFLGPETRKQLFPTSNSVEERIVSSLQG